jgi:AraC-like DNA-binding protein
MNLSFAELLYQTTKLPVCVIDQQKTIQRCFPKKMSGFYSEHFLEICLFDFTVQKKDLRHPFCITLPPAHYLGILQLSDTNYMILGPAAAFPHSREEILHHAEHQLYAEDKHLLTELLLHAPIMTKQQFTSAIALAAALLTGETIEPETIGDADPIPNSNPWEKHLTEYVFSANENALFHTPESLEAAVCSAIEEGNSITAEKLLLKRSSGKLGTLSLDPDRQAKYLFVTAAAVFSRAAVAGGLSYETACSIADIYVQQADRMSDPAAINAAMVELAKYFAQRVAETKGYRGYSELVKNCCDYIEKNLHTKITLKQLASVSNRSPQRLSQKFKNETGYSVVDYIHKAKMNEAKHLLTYSAFSLSEISNFLCYPNQSYFCKIFKETYGVTPQVYRSKKES